MDILSGKNKPNINQLDSNSAVSQSASTVVKWLIWFFTLTEEDQLKAGIFVGNGKWNE